MRIERRTGKTPSTGRISFRGTCQTTPEKVYNLALRIVGNPGRNGRFRGVLRAFLGLSGFRGESSFGTCHTGSRYIPAGWEREKHSNNVVLLYTEDDDGKEITVDVPICYSPRPRTSAKSRRRSEQARGDAGGVSHRHRNARDRRTVRWKLAAN